MEKNRNDLRKKKKKEFLFVLNKNRGFHDDVSYCRWLSNYFHVSNNTIDTIRYEFLYQSRSNV